MKLIRTAALVIALAGCTTAPHTPSLPVGAKYVAMGSSFAAGPGIPDYFEAKPAPCYRSTNNYAHLLAGRLNLTLTDVSCSGATTAHLTGRRALPDGPALPPQLDALTPDTRLVTITIGGNDIAYIGRLSAAACNMVAAESWDKEKCPDPPMPDEAAYATLEGSLNNIAKEVRRRSPDARLIFVDYLAILPPGGECRAVHLFDFDAGKSRDVARRLAAITAKAAADNGPGIVKASELSAGHDACASDPWTNGYPIPGEPFTGAAFHPNARGMAAIANTLEKRLAD